MKVCDWCLSKTPVLFDVHGDEVCKGCFRHYQDSLNALERLAIISTKAHMASRKNKMKRYLPFKL